MKLYRIRNWDKLFENNRTRDLKRLDWVPVPNRHDGENFCSIMAHPENVAIFGTWVLLLQVASKCIPRGTLLRDNGTPHTPLTLSVKTRAPMERFVMTLAFLEENTDWLIVESVGENPAPACGNSAPSCDIVAPEREVKPALGTFEEIRFAISNLYGDADRRWSHLEEAMLAEICRGGSASEEYDLIRRFRNSLPPQDRARFFPQSVVRLLEKWNEVLDRAKMLNVTGTGRAESKSLDKRLSNL